VGGRSVFWWDRSNQVAGSSTISSGMGAPWVIRSPKGVRPLKPNKSDSGGIIKGVPCACLKWERMHSKRCFSMVAVSQIVVHFSGSSGFGTSKCVSPPRVEGFNHC